MLRYYATFIMSRNYVEYAGLQVGLITVIEPAADEENLHGCMISRGYWWALCQCGTRYKVHTRDILNARRKAYSCPNCPKPPRRKLKSDLLRKPPETRTPLTRQQLAQKLLDRPHRGPAWRHLNQTYGRLTPVRWVDKQGWVCRCGECGGEHIIRRSQQLGQIGLTRCREVGLPVGVAATLGTSAANRQTT